LRDKGDRMLSRAKRPLERQLCHVLAIVCANVDSLFDLDEGEMEFGRARDRFRRSEAAGERMFHGPPQSERVSRGGLALVLRWMTRAARLRAGEILPLRVERGSEPWRACQRHGREHGPGQRRQYSSFKANWISRGWLTWLVTTPNCGLPKVKPGFPKRTRLNTLKNSVRNCRFIRPSFRNLLFLTSPKSMLLMPWSRTSGSVRATLPNVNA